MLPSELTRTSTLIHSAALFVGPVGFRLGTLAEGAASVRSAAAQRLVRGGPAGRRSWVAGLWSQAITVREYLPLSKEGCLCRSAYADDGVQVKRVA